ncbi:MAG: hypothetical protein ACLUFP_01880 [Streptococcus salivarius]
MWPIPEPSQVTADHFSPDDFFYFEILGENYHTEPIIGFAWGNDKQIYASTDTDLLKSEAFQAVFLKLLISTISSVVRSF